MNPPIPTQLHIVRGTDRADRIKDNEPTFDELNNPVNLELLDGNGLKEWKRIFPLMKERGLATEADEWGLVEWCEVISKLRFIHSKLTNEQLVIKKVSKLRMTETKEDGSKNRVQGEGVGFMINPYVKLYEIYFNKMLQLSARFGFTPADRTRINMPQPFSKKEKKDLIRRAII